MASESHYGYEYTCPFSGLVDYVGIGDENSRADKAHRMKSHLKGSHNGMLAAKLRSLSNAGVAPRYRKVVGGLTRNESYEWETSRIFEIGTVRDGTGPLFNVVVLQRDRAIFAFGSKFPTAVALQKDPRCCVDYLTLEYRIAAGWTSEDAATTPEAAFQAFGRSFPTLRELHEDAQCIVPYTTLVTRVLKGETPEEAAARSLEWVGAWGERFPSLQALSEDPRCHCPLEILARGVKRGCEHQAIAESFSGPVRIGGRVFPDLRALIENPLCRVTQETFINRVNRLGWSIERAVSEAEPIELLGEEYGSVEELSRHRLCRYDAETVLQHLKKHCEPEEAIGIYKPAFQHNDGMSLSRYIAEIKKEAKREIKDLNDGWRRFGDVGKPTTIERIQNDAAARIDQAKRDHEIWLLAQKAIDERRSRRYGLPRQQ